MSIVIIFGSLLAVLFAAAYFYVANAYSYWKRRGVPYLKPSFPFGNFVKFWKNYQMFPATLIELYNSSTDPVSGLYVICHPKLLVRDPEIIRDILVKSFSYFRDRGTFINEKWDPMSDNILFQGGNKWKYNRSKLSSAFNTIGIKAMFDMFIKRGTALHEQINQLAESGASVDVREMSRRYVTSVILSAALGTDIDCINDPCCEFLQYLKRFFNATLINMFRLNITFLQPKLAKLLGLRFATTDFSQFMIETVRQNVNHRNGSNINHKDFFQLLMQVNKDSGDKKIGMSIEEMSAQVYILHIAGSEASAIAFTFCIYQMARNTNIQNKAYEEIKNVLDKYDGALTYEALGEMQYIENCIDETLRLYPPIDMISRECTKDYKLPNSEAVIEKGTFIMIPVLPIQRDPKYYKEPSKFIPERFDTPKSFKEMPYLPFGDGPRICMGYRFAKLFVKVGIVSVLQKFQFQINQQNINEKLDTVTASLLVDDTTLNVIKR